MVRADSEDILSRAHPHRQHVNRPYDSIADPFSPKYGQLFETCRAINVVEVLLQRSQSDGFNAIFVDAATMEIADIPTEIVPRIRCEVFSE